MTLQSSGWIVPEAGEAMQAINLCERHRVSMPLTDLSLPNMSDRPFRAVPARDEGRNLPLPVVPVRPVSVLMQEGGLPYNKMHRCVARFRFPRTVGLTVCADGAARHPRPA